MAEHLHLTSGQVRLRPYHPTDADDLYAAARESVAEVSAWLPWCHPDYSIEESRTWTRHCPEAWREGTAYDFVIADCADSSFMGGCGLNHINWADRVANLGYWVRTSRTRQGVATAATLLLIGFGFDELKLNRIEIIAATGNTASQRVAEKAGAIREGVLRNRLAVGDRVFDAVMFSIVPQDVSRDR